MLAYGGCSDEGRFAGAVPGALHVTGVHPQTQWEIELSAFLYSLAEIVWDFLKYFERGPCISPFFKIQILGHRSINSISVHVMPELLILSANEVSGSPSGSVVGFLFPLQLKRLGRCLKSILAFCTGRLFKLHFQVCVIPT